MRKLIFIIVFYPVIYSSFAQTLPSVEILNQEINPGNSIDEFPLPPPQTKGSKYLFDDWVKGTVVLKSGDTLKNLQVQYDCELNKILVKQSEIKEFINPMVKYLLTDSYRLFNPANLGFASEDKVVDPLVALSYASKNNEFLLGYVYSIVKKEANYNPLLDMGERDHEISIKNDLYLFYKNKYVEVPKGKGAFSKMMESSFSISTDQKVNPKDVNELIAFLENLSK